MTEFINILVHSEGKLDSEKVKIGKNNNKIILYENMKLNIIEIKNVQMIQKQIKQKKIKKKMKQN